MRKPTICICFTAKLISAFVFATRIVQFLFFLNPKFPFSSHFLCLYRLVCVRPVRKPYCLFSHEAAHFMAKNNFITTVMSFFSHYKNTPMLYIDFSSIVKIKKIKFSVENF